jgi:hypothetical protein
MGMGAESEVGSEEPKGAGGCMSDEVLYEWLMGADM